MPIEQDPLPHADQPPNPGFFSLRSLYETQPKTVLDKHEERLERYIYDQIRVMELCEIEIKRRLGQEFHDPEQELPAFTKEVSDVDDIGLLELKDAAREKILEGLFNIDIRRSVDGFRFEEWT